MTHKTQYFLFKWVGVAPIVTWLLYMAYRPAVGYWWTHGKFPPGGCGGALGGSAVFVILTAIVACIALFIGISRTWYVLHEKANRE